MGLAQQQEVLVRLYTEPHTLEAFLQDPDAVLSRFRLTPQERANLRALDRDRLRHYASSLRHKRYNEVRRILPALSAHDIDLLKETFERYSESHPIPDGLNLVVEDALCFCLWWSKQGTAPRHPLRLDLQRLKSR